MAADWDPFFDKLTAPECILELTVTEDKAILEAEMSGVL
jgi:hypothetical protein